MTDKLDLVKFQRQIRAKNVIALWFAAWNERIRMDPNMFEEAKDELNKQFDVSIIDGRF